MSISTCFLADFLPTKIPDKYPLSLLIILIIFSYIFFSCKSSLNLSKSFIFNSLLFSYSSNNDLPTIFSRSNFSIFNLDSSEWNIQYICLVKKSSNKALYIFFKVSLLISNLLNNNTIKIFPISGIKRLLTEKLFSLISLKILFK